MVRWVLPRGVIAVDIPGLRVAEGLGGKRTESFAARRIGPLDLTGVASASYCAGFTADFAACASLADAVVDVEAPDFDVRTRHSSAEESFFVDAAEVAAVLAIRLKTVVAGALVVLAVATLFRGAARTECSAAKLDAQNVEP